MASFRSIHQNFLSHLDVRIPVCKSMFRLLAIFASLLPIVCIAQYPKAKIKPSPDFAQKARYIETERGNYVLITYKGKPFKKPPYKDWIYINPADSITKPKEQFDYCLAKGHFQNDTAYLLPYYEKGKPITDEEYQEFYEYTRDSIVCLEIGGSLIRTSREGKRRIDWSEAEKKLDYSDKHKTWNMITGLMYGGSDRTENDLVLDKRKITYGGLTQYHWSQTFSNCEYQYLSKGDPILMEGCDETGARKLLFFDDMATYEDTFLWASPRQMNVDSSMAVVLANYGAYLKNEIKWPLLNQDRACIYLHWYTSQLAPSPCGGPNTTKLLFEVDSSVSYPNIERYFNPFELRHFQITYGDYQEFLTYCHDSILSKTTPRDQNMWRQYRQSDKCFTLSRDSQLVIKSKCLVYYWQWVDQPKVYEEKLRHPWHRPYRTEFAMREERAVWNGSLPAEFLDQRISKELANETMDSLTFDQARAYWHWRLHIKMRDKKKTLADYMTPTYAEWKTIQDSAGVFGRTVKMPYPRRKFTYKVYVHL